MLFIREYNAKSLDRSSVSMIDKYNARLDRVGELLVNLSSLINNLFALIRDIRNTLGQSKQRIYDNLEQVKEVIKGNDITGTESAIDAIESALEAGDKAIDEAEATLEGIGAAISCSEEYCDNAVVDVECGETCNEIPDDDACNVCNYTISSPGGPAGCNHTECSVCWLDDCVVNRDCDEYESEISEGDEHAGCGFSSITYGSCEETVYVDAHCQEYTSYEPIENPPNDCVFTCTHASDCSELPMPEGCTYSCVDGNGCSYGGDDCSYSTTCGQEESCNQIDCSEYDCGEPCGETCHMTNDDDSGDSGSEGSCGEDNGNDGGGCSHDCDDGTDICGEDCGDSCGLF